MMFNGVRRPATVILINLPIWNWNDYVSQFYRFEDGLTYFCLASISAVFARRTHAQVTGAGQCRLGNLISKPNQKFYSPISASFYLIT